MSGELFAGRIKLPGAEMRCPTCGQPIPNKDLACRACAEAKSRQAFWEHQRKFLPDLLSGRTLLILVRKGEGRWHIELIGNQREAWCGESLTHQSDHRAARYSEQLLTEHNSRTVPLVCRLCRETFLKISGEHP